jgi:hypothetical protein
MNAMISAVFGWWGFPWGIIITPVQVARNTWGIFSGPDPSRPSEALARIARFHLASLVHDHADESAEPTDSELAANADPANPYKSH